jgi:2,5-diketo-D-gluconate reductase A
LIGFAPFRATDRVLFIDSTTSTHVPTVRFNDGHRIPQLGYGVWLIPDDVATECVRTAIDAGYRSIDTAKIYENERGVGAALRSSGVSREDMFVTTKLWNSDHNNVEGAFDTSMELLGLEYLDLYLMHWPAPQTGNFRAAWKAMVQLQESGRVRSIGVSNFNVEHLVQIVDDTGVVPAINQVELHPFFQQQELRAHCDQNGIAVEAWSPLGRGGTLLETPTITEIADELGKTPAQVVLRWDIQLGVVTIPKSVTPSRIAENLTVFDFELNADHMAAISLLDRPDGRIGPDPLIASF